jgi:chemotaxis protein MotC
MVVSDDYDTGMKALDGIAKVQLAARDEQLRQGVLAVAHEVRHLPQPKEPPSDAPITQGVAEKSPAALQLTAAAALIESVQKRVAEIDQLLKASPQ